MFSEDRLMALIRVEKAWSSSRATGPGACAQAELPKRQKANSFDTRMIYPRAKETYSP
jgi:hypothetical protein